MANETTSTTTIDAGIDKVWAAVADIGAYSQWVDGIERVTVLEEEAGQVKLAEFGVDAGPIRDEYQLEYTWVRTEGDDRLVSWTLAKASMVKELDGAYAAKAISQTQTEVTYRLKVATAMPLPGMMRRKAEKKIVDAALNGLKQRAESDL